MNTHSLLVKLAKQFPKRIAIKNHDTVGLMTGRLPKEVHKILLCLDFDEQVLPFAEEYKPDLILTHHPFIFGTKAKVFSFDEKKKEVCDKIDALGIPVYSMHTNFDEGKGGMNDALLAALNCTNVYAPMKNQMMRIGDLPEAMTAEEFAKLAKNAFNVDYSLLVKSNDNLIKKVAIIGGGGSRSWRIAQDEGADIYISGDAPHYVRRDVISYHYNYLDMPHEIEKIFMPTMKKILLGFDDTLEIKILDHEKLPKVIL